MSNSHIYVPIIVFEQWADHISQHHRQQRWCTFSSRCPFSHRERKMLAFFGANFGYFVTNLSTFGALFTGPNNVVVLKNQQI